MLISKLPVTETMVKYKTMYVSVPPDPTNTVKINHGIFRPAKIAQDAAANVRPTIPVPSTAIFMLNPHVLGVLVYCRGQGTASQISSARRVVRVGSDSLYRPARTR